MDTHASDALVVDAGIAGASSAAAGKLVAHLVAGRDPGEAGAVLPRVSPHRFARAA